MADRFPKDTAQQRTYRAFEALVAGEDAAIDLAQAALLIASIAYPDLDMAHYVAQLDALARRARAILALPNPDTLPQLPAETDPLAVISALNRVLFDEEQFHGNKEDYYNPDNSFFNKVLEKRRGIPITLSLLYIEVGKRVGIQIDGIALPYHFMVRARLAEGLTYIDPYEGGLLLSEQQCKLRIRQMVRGKIKMHAHWFEPISHKLFLARMLNNLKRCYLDKEDYERTLVICDLIILLIPHFSGEWRDRGIIHLQLKHYARALHDLTTYLELAPQADDRSEILSHIKTIRQLMAMMN
ncbi:MAG: transglutaminase family protein [Chloroflexi bacterium]|nr:transglutaminase family protein [Chloroflexota bacterium]